MKDREGKRMTDHYLVSQMAKRYPWDKRVYKIASGYVHMSETHILSTLDPIDLDSGIVGIKIRSHDQPLSDDTHIDAIRTFRQCSKIFALHLEDWTITKNSPEKIPLLKEMQQQVMKR